MNINIVPFECVGLLHFGASEESVIESIGAPEKAKNVPDFEGSRFLDYYSKGFSCYVNSLWGLYMIVVYETAKEAKLLGIPIFDGDLAGLLISAGAPEENSYSNGLGVLSRRLVKLGVDFRFDEEGSRAVHCYSKAVWDGLVLQGLTGANQ